MRGATPRLTRAEWARLSSERTALSLRLLSLGWVHVWLASSWPSAMMRRMMPG